MEQNEQRREGPPRRRCARHSMVHLRLILALLAHRKPCAVPLIAHRDVRHRAVRDPHARHRDRHRVLVRQSQRDRQNLRPHRRLQAVEQRRRRQNRAFYHATRHSPREPARVGVGNDERLRPVEVDRHDAAVVPGNRRGEADMQDGGVLEGTDRRVRYRVDGQQRRVRAAGQPCVVDLDVHRLHDERRGIAVQNLEISSRLGV